MEHEDTLRSLAMEHFGMRYDDPEVEQMIDENDWSDYWPVVNRAGKLTGDIVGSESGYYNVADRAMIHESNLSVEQVRNATLSGYADVTFSD